MDQPVASGDTAPKSADELADLLASQARSERMVGVELETALVRRDDLTPAPFQGAGGVEALLERLDSGGGYEAVREDGRLVGLTGSRGDTVTTEPGGQLEISTSPQPNLASLAAELREILGRLTSAAAAVGLRVVGGGVFPAAQEALPWMPKSRYRIMRDYFASLGEAGRLAHHMMQRTLSVQVSLDYLDGDDAAEQLRLAFQVAPVATAIFAAAPLDGLRESGFLSYRAEAWRFTDPGRAGIVAACARPGSTLRDWADYVFDVPMMFRVKDGDYHAQHGASFREVAEAGHWPDGEPVRQADLWNHMGGVFTDARLKKGLIELRSTDGQPPGHVLGVAAFWVGLLYDAQARAEAARLLDVDEEVRARAHACVPAEGLAAPWGDGSILDVSRAVLAAAKGGLERRVAEGLEEAASLKLLAPVEARLEAGRTVAEELLESWRGPWERDPARWIAALSFDEGDLAG